MSIRRCSKSVVVQPGWPPKWVAGRRWWDSTKCESSSVTMDISNLAMELRRVIVVSLGDVIVGLSWIA